MQQLIDLLFEDAVPRVNLEPAFRTLSFAFASGDTDGLFERLLDTAQSPPSTFDTECFAAELFVEELLSACLNQSARAKTQRTSTRYVTTILCHPPRSQATTLWRQSILRELQREETRREFEAIYRALVELRELLKGGEIRLRYEQMQRRFETLRAIARLYELLAGSFAYSRTGLARLRLFGEHCVSTEAYQRLVQLLAHEERIATLELRVQVGLDGQIRGFGIVALAEDVDNPYHEGPWTRLSTRLSTRLQLLFRGFRVTREELLARLTDHVFEALRPEVVNVFQLIGDMEFYLAGLDLQALAQSQRLPVCFPEFHPAGVAGCELVGLFNPLLVAAGTQVKPTRVASRDATPLMVVTGPNSGGKTRLLQSIGLCQLWGQAGLLVPAASARLPWCRGMFVSITTDASADQAEGRLGMELLRVRRLFERIAPGDLVIVDELCSGTNPSEAEEIFCLVVNLLCELRPNLWLTTHFLELAKRLRVRDSTPLGFVQVELSDDGHPTFQFTEGVANTSLAGQTAARLGVTAGELSELVRQAKARAR